MNDKITKVVAFLPAKGSSERIESKNMKLMDGKPLFLYTLEKLVSCEFIDEVYLDSESDEILNYAPYLNYIPLKRDPKLANNKTDGHCMFYNEVRQVEADIYVQILGTSPFIRKETIKKGIDILKSHQEYDSVVLVRREKQYTWNENGPVYDKNNIPNSINLPDTLIETMGLYIVRSDVAHKNRQRYGEHVYLLEAEAIEAVDVNFPDDFHLAEVIAKGLHRDEVAYFAMLSKHLSSCILSDIMWEYPGKYVITGLNLNLSEQKIMGRANTLKIRALKEEEDFRGIYDGLKTYKKMRSGEIIVVENNCPNNAYFGELNCNLAIRAGIVGTIISGVTRDANEVERLNFPVFSKGYCCSDVRGIATIENYNQKIYIEEVEVNPGDLIFGDVNGIVVIPKKLEREVLDRAIRSIRTEKSVLDKIIGNDDAYSIYQEEGAF